MSIIIEKVAEGSFQLKSGSSETRSLQINLKLNCIIFTMFTIHILYLDYCDKKCVEQLAFIVHKP